MFRIIRVPRTLDKFFRPLHCHFHWVHFEYFRLLVLVMVLAWGRHHVANLYRYLDAQHHRTRFNNFFLAQRWDPEAALRQKARELLRALAPRPGDTVYLILDDAKKAKRGKRMEAVAKMKDPTTDASPRPPIRLWHAALPRARHPLGYPALCEKRVVCSRRRPLPEDHRVGGPTHSRVQRPRRRQGLGPV